jgi:putative phosphoribosyl transferase
MSISIRKIRYLGVYWERSKIPSCFRAREGQTIVAAREKILLSRNFSAFSTCPRFRNFSFQGASEGREMSTCWYVSCITSRGIKKMETAMYETSTNAMGKNAFNFPLMIPEKVRMFGSRKEAGRRLAQALESYKGQNPLILAIPPGGAEVGFEVAKSLGADFSLVISKKLPFPDDHETSFGAITEDGSTYLHVNLVRKLSPEVVNTIKKEQLREIQGAVETFRHGRSLPDISGRTVILVDDSLTMGSTMKAAFLLCRKRHAAKIVVAVPVSGKKVMEEIRWLADEAIALESPEFLYDVAQIYDRRSALSDKSVLNILAQWEKARHQRPILDKQKG